MNSLIFNREYVLLYIFTLKRICGLKERVLDNLPKPIKISNQIYIEDLNNIVLFNILELKKI